MNFKLFFNVIFISLCFIYSNAQNLVINNSFEEFKRCPDNIGAIEYADNCYRISANNTPDYFHECSPNVLMGVPKNFYGNELAKTGKAYAGIGLEFNSNSQGKYREFINMILSTELKKNFIYKVSCYISKADLANYSAYGLTFCFVKKYHYNIRNENYNISCNTGCTVLNDKGYIKEDGWEKIECYYTASGGEKQLIIGFYYDSFTKAIMKKMKNNKIHENYPLAEHDQAYYYIDDVEVVEVIDQSTHAIRHVPQGMANDK